MKTGNDLLLLLAPPLSLIDKLDATPNLPDTIGAWVERWKAIRSDGPSEIDGVTDEVYQQALIIVVYQQALIIVDEKMSKKKAKAY